MTVPDQPGHDSPAALALASFGDGRFATLAGEAQQGDWAVVLLLTNEKPFVVPYEVVFHRDGGRWSEVAGNDSPGWRSTGGANGLVTFWAESPGGESPVRVSYRGTTATVPVEAGYFLAVFWDVPEDDFDPAAQPELTPSPG
ncbi:MAG: hypothetical protein JO016_02660 [Actinobacteria bacterium]|nr:hypothetical protein [Actinomycetota bacterium]